MEAIVHESCNILNLESFVVSHLSSSSISRLNGDCWVWDCLVWAQSRESMQEYCDAHGKELPPFHIYYMALKQNYGLRLMPPLGTIGSWHGCE